MGTIRRIFRVLKGFSGTEHALLDQAAKILTAEEFQDLKKELQGGERDIKPGTLDVPGSTVMYPLVSGKGSQELNDRFKKAAFSEAFPEFAKNAFNVIAGAIAPSIMGMQDVKEAACLQLFADERLHILLLGDPGTGKTEVLRSSEKLAVKSSMGLGSGTSSAGLSATYARGELALGLLPMANGGICCIDELNLMKKDDRASLYNAMEKGFITLDKGGRHEQFDADVRVIATANPKGDRFVGDEVRDLKKQLPFDPALLSRFHFVFLVRKPDIEQFTDIARKIARGNKKELQHEEFYKAYVAHASTQSTTFPGRLEPLVTEAARKIKEHENEVLIEVSPRVINGIIGFAKASARCELRNEANEEDVQRVLNILGSSLGLKL